MTKQNVGLNELAQPIANMAWKKTFFSNSNIKLDNPCLLGYNIKPIDKIDQDTKAKWNKTKEKWNKKY